MDLGVEFTTMSKTFSMAGWRIGYCAGNRKIVSALGAIKGYYDYGIFQAIQIASIIGLRDCGDLTAEQALRYQERRNTLATGLERMGWKGFDVPRAGMGRTTHAAAGPRGRRTARGHPGPRRAEGRRVNLMVPGRPSP